MKELTQAITEHAKDSIVEVIQQQGSPVKKQCDWTQLTQDSTDEQVEVQRAIERSMGVTAISMAKDPMISGNVSLKMYLENKWVVFQLPFLTVFKKRYHSTGIGSMTET